MCARVHPEALRLIAVTLRFELFAKQQEIIFHTFTSQRVLSEEDVLGIEILQEKYNVLKLSTDSTSILTAVKP